MGEKKNLIGERFGKLVVVSSAPSNAHGKRQWLCKCDCGGERVVTTAYLNAGRVSDCGCKKSPDLSGKTFGLLTVIGRSDKRSPRGERTVPLWECRCACGSVTYKATDTLTNSELSMCRQCAVKYAASQMRKSAGFVEGTQISRIKSDKISAANTSGARGVYYIKSTGKWRARLKFKGKLMNFGTFSTFEDALSARKQAEEEYYGSFLAQVE